MLRARCGRKEERMRILFMGTPEFAVPSLERLISDGHEVCTVFTQPDRPRGRGYELTPPPVKVCAQTHHILVEQPSSLRTAEAAARVRDLEPELIVVAAYGKILPMDILSVPRLGCVNVHASLLPKYRGAAPIQWAVINGEKETGVTTMQMAAGLDTGDMLLREATPIGENETAGELHDRLSVIGARLLSKTVEGLKQGNIKPQKQDDAASCYAPMLEKSLSKIDFSKPARTVHNLCRGLNPWPMAQTILAGRVLRLHETRAEGSGVIKGFSAPGTVVFAGTDGIGVACGDGGILRVLVLQESGKRPMAAAEYLRGHRVEPGMVCTG